MMSESDFTDFHNLDDDVDDDDTTYYCTPPDVRKIAESASSSLLPSRSKSRYEATYDEFIKWKKLKKISPQTWSESVLLAYFQEMKSSKKPSTVWARYSMLKSTLKINHNVNIESYSKLITLLKRNSEGFKSKKAKVFLPSEISKFFSEALDTLWLDVKVVAVFGILGACRADELVKLTINDIERHDRLLRVHIRYTKNKIPRSFVIADEYFSIVEKYEALRPAITNNDRFFLNFQNEKCTIQPIGINKLRKMPQRIAEFLRLPNAEEYTGHSFRRTSATIVANSGANIETLKRHGGWRSSSVAEGYIEDSTEYKRKTAQLITNSLNKRSSMKSGNSLPSSSKVSPKTRNYPPLPIIISQTPEKRMTSFANSESIIEGNNRDSLGYNSSLVSAYQKENTSNHLPSFSSPAPQAVEVQNYVIEEMPESVTSGFMENVSTVNPSDDQSNKKNVPDVLNKHFLLQNCQNFTINVYPHK